MELGNQRPMRQLLEWNGQVNGEVNDKCTNVRAGYYISVGV
jgi:hypothetical protein